MVNKTLLYLKYLFNINNLVKDRDNLIFQNQTLIVEKNTLLKERELLISETNQLKEGYGFRPPGHFYSPIPDITELRNRENLIWGTLPSNLPEINLNTDEQLSYFKEFIHFYSELPFQENKSNNLRYYFNNPNYSYMDAIILYSMIRKLGPTKIIEVGSGYSSCVMMDTNELFFNNKIEISFIEPYPELLKSLMKEDDQAKYLITDANLQNVKLDIFKALNKNDILFIDSSHISKIDSDVNYLFFNVLPALNKGVFIHLHDIFYPFEYPKSWIYEGRYLNENYVLRTFLEYNDQFKIVYFSDYFRNFYRPQLEKYMPLCLKNTGGDIWIEKIS